jgi:predicted GIY-YIG superfamily endonuclease
MSAHAKISLSLSIATVTGQVKATKHGVSWSLIHTETFATRREAVQRELYYKTGRGRDELDRLEQEGSARRQVALLSTR